MKLKYLLILVILFAFACKNTPKENIEQEGVTNEIAMVNVQKVELNIDGMTCSGCENAIQMTIDEFDGVYSSKADHVNSIAVLEIDSTKVDVVKVMDAINEMGYEAKDYNILSE